VASNYIPIASTTELGNAVKSAVRQVRGGIAILVALQATMVQAIDVANYAALETAFGLQAGDGTRLKAELDSMLSKVTTDASVTFVKAAIDQMAAKIGAY
jgi:hypothetical protein